MRLLCRVLGHRWRWVVGEPYLVCLRCDVAYRPQQAWPARRPVLRPTYPSWWRSGERAQASHRIRAKLRRKRAERMAQIAALGGAGAVGPIPGMPWGAAAGAVVARGTALGEDQQHRLNMQRYIRRDD